MAQAAVNLAADPEQAAERLARGLQPDFIVLAQERPGQFSTSQVETLRRMAPAAQVLGLLGTWCEGEGRSGQPWPEVPRIYWYHWPRLLRRLASPAADDVPFDVDADVSPCGGVVAVIAREYETSRWLVDACRACGAGAAIVSPSGPLEADSLRLRELELALWAGSDLNTAELRHFQWFAALVRPAPVLAVLDFPRSEDIDRAITAGACGVLAKPFQLADLAFHLRYTGQDQPELVNTW